MLIDVNDKSIDEQGERMVPAFHKGALVYGEHLTRYESVLELLRGKEVLDIASGSGYGTYVMAEAAKKVYGVEIDPESVAYAQRNYGRQNIEYLEGSAEKIPLADNSVDVVVTFETIEHIKNYRKFLSEMKRVLRPDGIAIVSTPNDDEFPEGNHFHLHEFKHDELAKLLKEYFAHTKFSYQYTWLYAAVMDDKAASGEWAGEFTTRNYAPVTKDKAIYFMVICSDKPVKDLAITPLGGLSEHWSARHQQDVEREQARQHHEEIKQRDTLIKAKTEELDKIYNSRGWRLLTKLYAVKYRLRKLLGRKSD